MSSLMKHGGEAEGDFVTPVSWYPGLVAPMASGKVYHCRGRLYSGEYLGVSTNGSVLYN